MSLKRFVLSLLLCLLSAPALQAATCPANNDLSTPTADFTVHGNGTVTHSKTGLMWKQCSEGQSGADCATGAATALTWADALTAAANANTAGFAGYSDWRLPSKQELQSIIETGCYSPSINNTVFPATASSYYWTSTTYAADPAGAWNLISTSATPLPTVSPTTTSFAMCVADSPLALLTDLGMRHRPGLPSRHKPMWR